MAIDVRGALDLLNAYLRKVGAKRSFVICGGASLILQGIVGRGTKDIDIVGPQIDEVLREASVFVAQQLGLDSHWLNTDPKGLAKEMQPGWEKRIIEVYSSSNLLVYSISRPDMIFSKFYAYCDRQKDIQDLVDLGVSEKEIDEAARLTEKKDGNPDWPEHVENQRIKLRKKMGYE